MVSSIVLLLNIMGHAWYFYNLRSSLEIHYTLHCTRTNKMREKNSNGDYSKQCLFYVTKSTKVPCWSHSNYLISFFLSCQDSLLQSDKFRLVLMLHRLKSFLRRFQFFNQFLFQRYFGSQLDQLLVDGRVHFVAFRVRI